MAGFRDILGQEKVVSHFKNAIKAKKISHAYILHGDVGMGKKMMAAAFAMTLQCEKGGTDACMECVPCKQCLSGNHPDVKWITHEKSGVISVDEIRKQINSDILIKPYSSQKKIYIVPDAEKMNQAAQNALLKTIEEPPDYAVILLLSANKDSFLQTILSRCVVMDLKPVKQDIIVKYLTIQQRIVDYRAREAAVFSGGNIGKAVKMCLSDDFFELKEDVIYMAKQVSYMNVTDIQESCKEIIKKYKEQIDEYLYLMQLWYRDLLIYKLSQNQKELIFQKEEKKIGELAKKMKYSGIEHSLQSIDKIKFQIKSNVNMELALEMMFIKMKQEFNGG